MENQRIDSVREAGFAQDARLPADIRRGAKRQADNGARLEADPAGLDKAGHPAGNIARPPMRILVEVLEWMEQVKGTWSRHQAGKP